MTVAAIRKYQQPSPDDFFDLEDADAWGTGLDAARRAALAAHRGGEVVHRIRQAAPDGVYAVSRRDAAAMNRALDLPEQPNYDWADVFEEDE